jgi:hypothetical protein
MKMLSKICVVVLFLTEPTAVWSLGSVQAKNAGEWIQMLKSPSISQRWVAVDKLSELGLDTNSVVEAIKNALPLPFGSVTKSRELSRFLQRSEYHRYSNTHTFCG